MYIPEDVPLEHVEDVQADNTLFCDTVIKLDDSKKIIEADCDAELLHESVEKEEFLNIVCNERTAEIRVDSKISNDEVAAWKSVIPEGKPRERVNGKNTQKVAFKLNQQLEESDDSDSDYFVDSKDNILA